MHWYISSLTETGPSIKMSIIVLLIVIFVFHIFKINFRLTELIFVNFQYIFSPISLPLYTSICNHGRYRHIFPFPKPLINISMIPNPHSLTQSLTHSLIHSIGDKKAHNTSPSRAALKPPKIPSSNSSTTANRLLTTGMSDAIKAPSDVTNGPRNDSVVA